MQKLTKEEMLNVNGGSGTGIIVSAISGIIVFIVGVLHGYVNPKKCNN